MNTFLMMLVLPEVELFCGATFDLVIAVAVHCNDHLHTKMHVIVYVNLVQIISV